MTTGPVRGGPTAAPGPKRPHLGVAVLAGLALVALLLAFPGPAAAAPPDDFVITVKTDNPGLSNDDEFTIPTYSIYDYRYDVDWGDGNTDSDLDADVTHTYAEPGTYTIRISGTFPAIRFNNTGDKDKLLSVDQWGTGRWSSFSSAFYGASNLTLAATDTPDLSNVFGLASTFKDAPLVDSGLADWDVSTIRSFTSTFEGATSYDEDIAGWDVSNAVSMRSMFRDTSFNQDIGSWDVSNVDSMANMFFGNTVFDQPIEAWGAKTGNVDSFANMFFGASSFNRPVGSWDTGSATNMQSMFRAASSFDQDLSGWDTSNVTTMGLMFMLSSFDQDISGWDTSNVADMSYLFRATPFDQDISGWNVGNVANFDGMFQDADQFNQDVSGWDTASATSMAGTFRSADRFDQDLSGWNFSQVTDFELFLDDTAIPDEYYDRLLNSIRAQAVINGVQRDLLFGALGLRFCEGATARASLTETYGWTFVGDAIECPPGDPTIAPDLQPRSDTGQSDSDDATSLDTPTFDVECTVAGAVVVLFSDNPEPATPIGSHRCFEAGIEPATAAPGLPDGVHTISYLLENRKGRSAVSPSLVITIDSTGAAYNPIELENKNPGTDAWQLDNPADDLGKQIKGYASATSVNLGGSIDFHVSVDSAQSYTIDVYRMGWYQGWGGRLIDTIGPLAAAPQTYAGPDPVTGMIAYDWPVSHTLDVPTGWTSGIYLAKLTNAEGYENYIPFTVRDDERPAALLYQQAVTTDQAYNNFPDVNPNDPGYDRDDPTHQGKSLYGGDSSRGDDTIAGDKRAVKVSFDRPYARDGSALFFRWEHDQIKWLEKMGYDLAYSTNLDTHTDGARLGQYQGFISAGHDEYWTGEMFDAAEAARDDGVSLAFFGSNAVYWQIRFEPSAAGVPNRTVVSYKNATIDPEPVLERKTNRFRDIGRPEQSLIGIMYDGYNGDLTTNTAFVPTNLGHWIYADTGFVEGDSVPGIIGYEYDVSNPSYPLPANVSYDVLSSSPFVDNNADTVLANAAVYQAPSEAWVFASGTMSWSWGLARPGLADVRIERMTENFFDRVLNPVLETTAIIGAVTAADGAVVEGANVDLFEQAESGDRGPFLGSADTDEDGSYRFDIDPGCKVLTFEAPTGESFNGGRWLQVPTCVESGQTVTVDVALDGVVSGGASVGGTVTTAEGAGVVAVDVDRFVANADGSRGQYIDSAQTDDAGTFLFAPVVAQCYVFTFSAPAGETFNGGSWLNLGRCVAEDETVTDLDAVLDGDVVTGTTVGGTITTAAGAPVADVSVDLFQQGAAGERGPFLGQTRSDSDGRYRFEVEAGCYVATLIAPDAETFDGSRWFQTSGCVEAGQALETLDGVLDAAAEADLGGTITQGEGQPSEGVLVDFYRTLADGSRGAFVGSAVSGADGRYNLGVAEGCYWLVLVAPDGRLFTNGGQYLESFRCVASGEVVTDLDATLEPIVD